MEQKELIVDVIREACSNAVEMRGSVLGAILKARIPQLNRGSFGGVRKFVQSECSDFLQFARKQGGDDVFRVVDGKEKPFIADNAAVWRVFGNPNENGELLFDVSSSAILLGSKELAEGEDSLKPIQRITHEEQKALILEFASNELGEDGQELVKTALESEDYWQLTTGIFRTSKPSQIGTFVNFRKGRWLGLLKERLIAAGASELQAEMLCTSLSKPRALPAQADQAVSIQRDRQVLIDLISRMSDAELDQLSLPLWTVAGMVNRLTR